jgi:hypothetical protein
LNKKKKGKLNSSSTRTWVSKIQAPLFNTFNFTFKIEATRGIDNLLCSQLFQI